MAEIVKFGGNCGKIVMSVDSGRLSVGSGRLSGWVGQMGRYFRWVRKVSWVVLVWLGLEGSKSTTTGQYARDKARYRNARAAKI